MAVLDSIHVVYERGISFLKSCISNYMNIVEVVGIDVLFWTERALLPSFECGIYWQHCSEFHQCFRAARFDVLSERKWSGFICRWERHQYIIICSPWLSENKKIGLICETDLREWKISTQHTQMSITSSSYYTFSSIFRRLNLENESRDMYSSLRK